MIAVQIHISFYIRNNQSNTLKHKEYINTSIKIINLGPKNGPVGWNGLNTHSPERNNRVPNFAEVNEV